MGVYLSREEERMIKGEYGPGVQKSMELLVKVGDAFDAERMIEPKGAHIVAWEGLLGKPGEILIGLLSELTEEATVKVPTTVNPLLLNLERAKKIGIPETMIKEVQKFMPKLLEIHRKIGAIPVYTCHPHWVFEFKKGDHYAITESGVLMFANSWFGVMSNIEGGPSAVASAVTGRTPEYGLHIPENRHGRVLVEIGKDLDAKKFTYADYGALSYYVGRILTSRIAVYNNLPKNVTAAQAKYMCLPQIISSSAPMFHIVGVTPEAPTVEAAFGGEKPEENVVFGKKELEETSRELCSATDTKIDLVLLGCPHCTLREIGEIAQLLEGKKVREGVRLWIGVGEPIRLLAERMGYVGVIEEAGGLAIPDQCVGDTIVSSLGKSLGIKTIATTSAAIAIVLREVWFGSLQECINAAILGKWKGK